jgi:hypothetical protein
MQLSSQSKITILAGLLLLSVAANVFLLAPSEKERRSGAVYASPALERAPGYRSHVVTVYDGKKVKTYATTTTLTEADIRRIEEDFKRHEESMREFFRRQDELFRAFWSRW